VPEEPTEAPTLLFLADQRRVALGECTELEWQSNRVVRVYLDGRQVDAVGSLEVCPETTTSYELTAVFDDGTEGRRVVKIQVDVPTEAATETPQPTLTSIPPTKAPEITATPTITPTPEVSVEFYPDNGIYELPRDQKCTAINWKTSGVTNVQLEMEGRGRLPVGPEGRQDNVCFDGRVTFYLYVTLPDGREERHEMELRHKN
jgi:hypothetical protein